MPPPTPSAIPLARDALGLGLRVAHYAEVLATPPRLDYFEVISENFMSEAARPRHHLDLIRAHYPIVLHGVGLNLLGHDEPDEAYLDRLCALAEHVNAPFVTDHLCWTSSHGLSHHDLLPTPYVPELIEIAAERAQKVQARLGRPFGLENLSSYVSFRESCMSEWEFYAAVVRKAGCYSMLDINNVYVSSVNHGFDPRSYLDAMDYTRVLQVHLAGHAREADGSIVDTHDCVVSPEVWALYADTYRKHGPFPTLVEWDAAIPPLAIVMQELEKAREVRR